MPIVVLTNKLDIRQIFKFYCHGTIPRQIIYSSYQQHRVHKYNLKLSRPPHCEIINRDIVLVIYYRTDARPQTKFIFKGVPLNSHNTILKNLNTSNINIT